MLKGVILCANAVVGLICPSSHFECELWSCWFCVFVVSKRFVVRTCGHYVPNLWAFVTLVGEPQVCYFMENKCLDWIIRVNQGDLYIFQEPWNVRNFNGDHGAYWPFYIWIHGFNFEYLSYVACHCCKVLHVAKYISHVWELYFKCVQEKMNFIPKAFGLNFDFHFENRKVKYLNLTTVNF